MEHTKKFVLVDPRVYRQSEKENPLSKLDSQINQILHSDSPDDIKAKEYSAILNKFKNQEDNIQKPPETRLTEQNFESDIIQSIPPTQQYKAKRLLNYLKNDPDIKWSDNGELVYRQSRVPNSHIIDILSDILKRSTVGENPNGWEQIANSLRDQNVPREYITNAKRWKYIKDNSLPVDEIEQEVHATPEYSTPKDQSTSKSKSATPVKRKSTKSRRIDWVQY